MNLENSATVLAMKKQAIMLRSIEMSITVPALSAIRGRRKMTLVAGEMWVIPW
jgi:hypothetical protein